MSTVMITGGTGLIGTALCNALTRRNYDVIILTRTPRAGSARTSYARWNIEENFIDPEALGRADHIIHLAGAGVGDKRWTKKRKREIRDSRVEGGRLLARALSELPNKVKSVVSASGVGWYGPDRDKTRAFTEDDPPYGDFLGQTCKAWEESIAPVVQNGRRLAILRTGIALSLEGGAIPEFIRPMKFGFATILGSGRQVISWIHIEDLCRLYITAIENESMHGVFNAVAPEKVTNRQFVKALSSARGKSVVTVHVPSFVLKVAVGEMSVEVLKSATVSEKKTKAYGFTFLYPTVESAMHELFAHGNGRHKP